MANFLFLIIAAGLSLTFVTNTYAVDTVINTATTSTIVLSTSGDTLTVDSTGQVTISSGNAVENNVNVIAPFINNSGLLSGGTYLFNSGIENAGTINVLTNSSTGIIYGFYGVRNLSAGTIQTLTNSNDITGTRVGIYNSFSI
jgi:mucin-19